MLFPTCLVPRFAVLVAFGWLAAAPVQAASPYVWKNVAIKGGGFVTGLVFHPAERGLLYARTDVGGAYRWQPDSSSWLPLNDALGRDDSQLTGVLSVALDPQDPERVYLATGQYLAWWAQDAAILRSTDRGLTWARTTLPLKLGGNSDGRSTGERLQVDPHAGATLLLGTNQDGLWRSADHGVTWTKIDSFPATAVTFVLFDRRSGTIGAPTPTVYAGIATTAGAALLRSTDAGATWNAVSGQPGGLLPQHAKLASDGVLYVTYSNGLGPNGVSSGAVWKMDTGNDAWTNITPPTGQGGFAGLAIDAQHPGTLLVTTLDRWWPGDEIYRSTDAGATWQGLGARSVRDHTSAPYAAASTPHWLGDIEIDPFDSARAFYITGYGVFGTETLSAADTNGQVTWYFRNDGLEETVPLGLVSPPEGPPLVSVIGDIDGFRHDDLTVSPPEGRSPPQVGTCRQIDFAELAPALMVRIHDGGTQRGSRSTDAGRSWTYFPSAPAAATANNGGAIAISADGARLVWAPRNAALFHSSDNGSTWNASTGGPAASGSASYTPVADRVSAAKFYVYDPAAGRVYVSTSGGSSFSAAAANLPTNAEPLRATPGQEGHLWLPAGADGLYRSTDSGASFTPVAAVEEAYRLGFGKPAPGQTYPALYAWARIGGVTGFFRSDDEAATWSRINDDAHQFGWINAIIGDPRVYGRVYLATGGRGIVYGEPASTGPAVTWSTPTALAVATGASTELVASPTGWAAPTFQWRRNGTDLPGASAATLPLASVQPGDAGLYVVTAMEGPVAVTSTPTLVGVTTAERVIGAGEVKLTNVQHPNGNHYDQVLLTGAAEAITADHTADRIVRTSFIDLDGDIVQVEFAGPGTLSLVLDQAGPRAAPERYNQSELYVQGHAGIVITGATEQTHVSVFTVGRMTAFDPTGAYDLGKPVGPDNDPANNGNPLFAGHPVADYDGMADLAFIAIASTDGRFGGLRAANASFFAAKGFTGIYAPGVDFAGPVYVSNISAYDAAVPVLRLGAAADVRITGGDLFQDNAQPVQVSGITQLRFTAGTDSHHRPLAAQANRGVLQEDDRDVTSQIVVNPEP